MRSIIDLKAADHPVKAVTIFATTPGSGCFGKTGKAEVTRAFNVDLKEGENRVHIHGLSSYIDRDSARVSGPSDDIQIFDIVCSLKQQHQPAEDDVQETMRQLRKKKDTFEQLKLVRTQEAIILVQYGMSLKGTDVDPDTATSFLTTFVQSGQDNIQAVAKLDDEIISIERELKQLQDQAAERKGDADGHIAVVLHAKVATTVELRLTYLVDGAFWNAAYDLYATTTENGQSSPAVELHFRARVSQATGEDWADTSLTLSTAAFDALGQGLPAFKPLRIAPPAQPVPRGLFGGSVNSKAQPTGAFNGFGQAQTAPPAQATGLFGGAFSTGAPMAGLFGQTPAFAPQQHSASAPQATSLFGHSSAPAPQTSSLFGQTVPIAAPPPPPVAPAPESDGLSVSEFTDLSIEGTNAKAGTVVSESPFSRTYCVDGKSAIPSDGRDHQVLVAVLPFEARLSYVALPRAQTVAYMQCEVKNTSEYRLLSGPVNVFMDGSTVSRTQIQDVGINDTFECTLGADPSIRLTFARTAKPAQVEGGAFAEPTRTVAYAVITTIKNTHGFDLPRVVVRDSVPVAGEDKRIRVVLRKPAKLADAKEGESVSMDGVKVSWGKHGLRDGQLEWVAEVKSGAEVKLETEFEVRAPADSKWQLRLDA